MQSAIEFKIHTTECKISQNGLQMPLWIMNFALAEGLLPNRHYLFNLRYHAGKQVLNTVFKGYGWW
jgi:hypothetical protein